MSEEDARKVAYVVGETSLGGLQPQEHQAKDLRVKGNVTKKGFLQFVVRGESMDYADEGDFLVWHDAQVNACSGGQPVLIEG